MLTRLRQARLVGATLLTLVALAILAALGTWQLQRKHWKEGLIAQIAARVQAPPVPLERAEAAARAGEDIAYLHVAARGRFQHDKERYLYAPGPEGLGWHVYTPLEMAAGRLLWVNRGRVPDDRRAPGTRPQGQVAGETEVSGLVRPAMPATLFTPANDVARNVWHWPSPAALTASAYGPGDPGTIPLTLDADALPEPPGGLPKGGVTRLELPNRHLAYAFTWYGVGLSLIGVYLAFAVGRLRAGRKAQ